MCTFDNSPIKTFSPNFKKLKEDNINPILSISVS